MVLSDFPPEIKKCKNNQLKHTKNIYILVLNIHLLQKTVPSTNTIFRISGHVYVSGHTEIRSHQQRSKVRSHQRFNLARLRHHLFD